MTLELRATPECGVCRQLITAERVGDACAMVALVGAAPYAQCPACRQEVRGHEAKAYRRRARRWVARRDGGMLLIVIVGTDSAVELAAAYRVAQAELPQFELVLIDRDKAPEQADGLRLYGSRFYLLTAAPPETWAEEMALQVSSNIVAARGKNNSEKVCERD